MIEGPSYEGMTYRHSIKSDEKGPNPSISEAGVELAQFKGETEILDAIKSSENEIVVVMGVSVFQRTRQTSHQFIEGIKRAQDPEIRVIDLQEVKEYSKEGFTSARNYILQLSDDIDGKKIVLELPLHLHGLDGNEIIEKNPEEKYGARLLREEINLGEKTINVPVIKPEFKEILSRVSDGEGQPAELIIKDYLDALEKGEELSGVDPNEAADLIINTFKRQALAAQKLLPNKKVSFINVTHDYGITLAIVKLLNGGKFDRRAQEMAKEISTSTAEGFGMVVQNGNIKVSFRDREVQFPINGKEENNDV